ncbi:hypothetical protein AC781_00765 [Akkermansia glycaniphila]|nr:hypothetical protein AC781_00765 [Akkermansia glycaniphila]
MESDLSARRARNRLPDSFVGTTTAHRLNASASCRPISSKRSATASAAGFSHPKNSTPGNLSVMPAC